MRELKIAIAGVGTVGSGLIDILKKNNNLINKNSSQKIIVTAVASRRKIFLKENIFKSSKIFSNATELLKFDNYDVLVELIGGEDGVAKKIIFNALNKNKHVVSANKALFAKHGEKILKLADKKNLYVGMEASVAGVIPIIKILKEFLSSNRVKSVFGILNGTSNYILSKMLETNQSFNSILTTAQKLGYAESDPKYDIDGTDTAHKLSIISSLSFESKFNMKQIYIEGISNIDLIDLQNADALGYRIKLLGLTERKGSKLIQFVYPCLIKKKSIMASVNNVYNGIVVESDFANKLFFQGEGAGSHPTATSVVSDIINISNITSKKIKKKQLKNFEAINIRNRVGSYYIRLTTLEKSGVIADVTNEFKKFKISVNSLLQKESKNQKKKNVTIIFTTHKCKELEITKALKKIDSLSFIIEKTVFYRIENF